MSDWIACPACHLRHTARPDGVCPRCRGPVRPAGHAAAPAPLAGAEPLPAGLVAPGADQPSATAPGQAVAGSHTTSPMVRTFVVVIVDLVLVQHHLRVAWDFGIHSFDWGAYPILFMEVLAFGLGSLPWLAWIIGVAGRLRAEGARDVPSGWLLAFSALVPLANLALWPHVHVRLWRIVSLRRSRGRDDGEFGALLLWLYFIFGYVIVWLASYSSPLLEDLGRSTSVEWLNPSYSASRPVFAVLRLLAAALSAGAIAIVVAFHRRLGGARPAPVRA